MYIFFFLYKTQVAAFYFLHWMKAFSGTREHLYCVCLVYLCVGCLPIVPVPLWLQGFSVYYIPLLSSFRSSLAFLGINAHRVVVQVKHEHLIGHGT